MEIEKNCPTSLQFLVTFTNGNVDHPDEKKVPPICVLYAVPMFLRVPELSRLRGLTTILLAEKGVSKMASYTLPNVFYENWITWPLFN